jgi:NitT/TauT family transport system substrate-binding protein
MIYCQQKKLRRNEYAGNALDERGRPPRVSGSRPVRRTMRIGRRALLLAPVAAALPARAATPIRVGTLRYGSVAWEMDVIRTRGLAGGTAIELVEYAASQASQVALQAGRVDMIVQDWLWVTRQRASGADFTLSPSSGALGAMMVPADSPLKSVADLAGKRVGIAGSPLDKSWLILRAYAMRTLKIDLNATVDKNFGPPPLLAQQFAAGRLDAMLTYWPFAARAEAAGDRPLLSIEDAVASLGGQGVSFLGYVFSDAWARANAGPVASFLAATAQAREVLRTDDAEWQRLKPLTGTANQAELEHVRDWYRRGVPGAPDPAAAARLYDLLAAIGGRDLVGPAAHLTPGTFWVA